MKNIYNIFNGVYTGLLFTALASSLFFKTMFYGVAIAVILLGLIGRGVLFFLLKDKLKKGKLKLYTHKINIAFIVIGFAVIVIMILALMNRPIKDTIFWFYILIVIFAGIDYFVPILNWKMMIEDDQVYFKRMGKPSFPVLSINSAVSDGDGGVDIITDKYTVNIKLDEPDTKRFMLDVNKEGTA